MKIKINDKVRILSGRDKGKEGKVIQALPKLGMVVVEGINTTVRHLKAKGKQAGQKVTYSAPVRVSKVAKIDEEKAAKPTKSKTAKKTASETVKE
jgi:large subunit ribosomal protein L24